MSVFEPLLLEPGAKLTEVEVEAIGDNISLGMLDRGGGIDIVVDLGKTDEAVPLGNSRAMVDGDFYQRWRHGTASRGQDDILAHMIFDLGAVYWLDQVRIIGGVVVRSGFGGGITTSHFISRRRWGLRFYEMMTSDGSLSPDGTRVWTKHFSGEAPISERSRGLVDHHFELIPARYVRVFWKFWDTNCGSDGVDFSCAAGGATDEFQIYGIGHPREVALKSGLIDLGGDKNLNSIEWGADTPPGTRVEIRSRTGNELIETLTYLDRNGREITQRKWEKTPSSLRGAVDTSFAIGSGWSPWSKIYGFSGEAFQSPSPRSYMELEVKLVSDFPETAANLDFLAINFTDPLASAAVGEITPVVVDPGVTTEFTYYLRPERPTSFDRLSIESSAPVTFMGLAVDGNQREAQTETMEGGFQVTLPTPIRSNQLIEMRFESSIFFQSTRFDLFLSDTNQDQQIRQRVDPGDATDLVSSNSNVVQLPVKGNLFADIEILPKTLTPNGDGINDQVSVDLNLINVLDPRPLRLNIFDLSGRLLYYQSETAVAGPQQLTWDGRAPDGTLVPPGIYILEVKMEGDARQERTERILGVTY